MMRPTRRRLTFMAAAMALTPIPSRAETRGPLVVSDGAGADDERAGTADAYERAITDGANYLAADLVACQSGDLIVLPGGELSSTTDVADHPEFANRKTSKAIGGDAIEGWFVEDFSLAELKTLSRGVFSNAAHAARSKPARASILTFQDVIDLARAASVRTARVVGLYARLRRPAYFASLGLELERRVADAAKINGYNSTAAAMFVVSPEIASLKSLAMQTRVRRVFSTPPPSEASEAAMEPWVKLGDYVAAVELEEAAISRPRQILDFVHARGLAVYIRASDAPRKPEEAIKALAGLFSLGADAIVTGEANIAVAAREAASRLLEKQRRLGKL